MLGATSAGRYGASNGEAGVDTARTAGKNNDGKPEKHPYTGCIFGVGLSVVPVAWLLLLLLLRGVLVRGCKVRGVRIGGGAGLRW